MITMIRREWRNLSHAPAGKRFQLRYRRTRDRRIREHESPDDAAPKVLRLVAGFVLLAIGLCLTLFPLVYIPFILASGAMFASESLTFAHMLDRLEVFCRRSWTAARRKAGLSPRSAKMIAAVVGIGCLVVMGFACYRSLSH
jgi:uncharacterized membrane protein YbaN (DUF454 family)